MYCREKYCALCGCLFSLPKLRNPENPDPDEDPLLVYSDPYDSRVLPRELTEWLTKFRVIGHRDYEESLSSSFKDESSTPALFLSGPAEWHYDRGAATPAIPASGDKSEEVWVYDDTDASNGMLFPVHEACLGILRRLCQIRRERSQPTNPMKPTTVETFCDALQHQRRKNLNKPVTKDNYYYAKSGGIEWPHGYYGARQFWADEWNTEPGWELLCADPSPLKIRDLPCYILSQLPRPSSSTPSTPTPSRTELTNRLGWLFLEEIDNIAYENQEQQRDWEKGIQILQEQASLISADEGGEDDGKKKLASAPLGLKNRWRIWKILEGIEYESAGEERR